MGLKHKIFFQSLYKYFFEFIVVFIGVFLAFVLSQYQDKKNKDEKRREIYIAIYQDLNSFYESGKEENENGFVNVLTRNVVNIDSAIAHKQFPARTYLYADSWYVPIVNSLTSSGAMKDIDIDVFKTITKFNSGHQIFLEHIISYNDYYDKYITANYDKGIDFFYQKDTNALKPKYMHMKYGMTNLAQISKILVERARVISIEIKEKHIDTK